MRCDANVNVNVTWTDHGRCERESRRWKMCVRKRTRSDWDPNRFESNRQPHLRTFDAVSCFSFFLFFFPFSLPSWRFSSGFNRAARQTYHYGPVLESHTTPRARSVFFHPYEKPNLPIAARHDTTRHKLQMSRCFFQIFVRKSWEKIYDHETDQSCTRIVIIHYPSHHSPFLFFSSLDVLGVFSHSFFSCHVFHHLAFTHIYISIYMLLPSHTHENMYFARPVSSLPGYSSSYSIGFSGISSFFEQFLTSF